MYSWTGAHIKTLEDRVEAGETRLQQEFSDEIEADVLASKAELDVWLKWEETHLAQQVKLDWVSHGETSAKFFKAIQVRKHNVVREMVLDIGSILSSPDAIHDAAVLHFEEFLQEQRLGNSLPVLSDLINVEADDAEK